MAKSRQLEWGLSEFNGPSSSSVLKTRFDLAPQNKNPDKVFHKNCNMPDDKINITLSSTPPTLDADVEQREPSRTETSLSNEAGARDENENSSVRSDSKIDENAADHVAINVHHDCSSHIRRSTEAEEPIDLKVVPALDSPLPLQMIQSQNVHLFQLQTSCLAKKKDNASWQSLD